MESNCCGASEWMPNTDICSDCKEHAEFGEYEEAEEVKKILSGLESFERTISLMPTHPYYYDADEEEVSDWDKLENQDS
jgi:hypothetical protein